MTLREWLNYILSVIGTVSLTDDEYSVAALTAAQDFSVTTYGALKVVVEGRAIAGNTLDRLRYYFLARGTAVPDLTYDKSNIFFGASLED